MINVSDNFETFLSLVSGNEMIKDGLFEFLDDNELFCSAMNEDNTVRAIVSTKNSNYNEPNIIGIPDISLLKKMLSSLNKEKTLDFFDDRLEISSTDMKYKYLTCSSELVNKPPEKSKRISDSIKFNLEFKLTNKQIAQLLTGMQLIDTYKINIKEDTGNVVFTVGEEKFNNFVYNISENVEGDDTIDLFFNKEYLQMVLTIAKKFKSANVCIMPKILGIKLYDEEYKVNCQYWLSPIVSEE